MNKELDLEDEKYLKSGELILDEDIEAMMPKELVESTLEGHIIYIDEDGYYFEKIDAGRSGFLYSVFSPDGVLIDRWPSYIDLEKRKDFTRTGSFEAFKSAVEEYKKDMNGEDDEDFWGEEEIEPEDADIYPNNLFYTRSNNLLYPSSFSWPSSNRATSHYSYTPPAKEKGFLEKLNKSNTLVFHRDDPSTRMLCQVYQGKGWDVLTTSCDRIDNDELKELFRIHDRLVFLGHGSPSGLIGMFGSSVAPLMQGKKIFAIWCNADKYFIQNGIGDGQFITKNVPSEKWECSAAGCGNISKELMLENITYWSKLCADVVEEALEGNPQKAVDYVRKNYLEKYGNHPVSIYNALATQVLGEEKPLPEYKFTGKKLESIDYPIPNFDEEAFLANPTPDADDCPTEEAIKDVNIGVKEEE